MSEQDKPLTDEEIAVIEGDAERHWTWPASVTPHPGAIVASMTSGVRHLARDLRQARADLAEMREARDCIAAEADRLRALYECACPTPTDTLYGGNRGVCSTCYKMIAEARR